MSNIFTIYAKQMYEQMCENGAAVSEISAKKNEGGGMCKQSPARRKLNWQLVLNISN